MTTKWRKSSRSTGGNNSACVETRQMRQQFQVRDSKLDDRSPTLGLIHSDFVALLQHLK